MDRKAACLHAPAMALTATLYTLQLELSDVDRNVYESLSLRVAQHPSEDGLRLMARVLAYGLFYEPSLEFGRGLSNAEEPALWARERDGRITHWIDVGHPSAERLHRASKAAARVTVVCHKDVGPLKREVEKRSVHRAEQIEVWLFPETLIAALCAVTSRRSTWSLVQSGGELMITVDDARSPIQGAVERRTLSSL